jgi:hypothetical protein
MKTLITTNNSQHCQHHSTTSTPCSSENLCMCFAIGLPFFHRWIQRFTFWPQLQNSPQQNLHVPKMVLDTRRQTIVAFPNVHHNFLSLTSSFSLHLTSKQHVIASNLTTHHCFLDHSPFLLHQISNILIQANHLSLLQGHSQLFYSVSAPHTIAFSLSLNF